MEDAPTSPRAVAIDTGRPTVTVRYWAAARAAAGRAEDVVSGESVAEVLAAVGVVHAANPRFLHVLGISSLLLGDSPVGSRDRTAVQVHDEDILEVLPPFAGG